MDQRLENIRVSNYVDDYIHVQRSFKERWFSLPWRPWVTMKTVHQPKVYMCGGKTYLVSPSTYSRIVMGESVESINRK